MLRLRVSNDLHELERTHSESKKAMEISKELQRGTLWEGLKGMKGKIHEGHQGGFWEEIGRAMPCMGLFFQEEYYCPGPEDPEDFSQCCEGRCCPVSDSKMTTGTILVIVLIILNVGLILTVILLCRTKIKSSNWLKFRHSQRSRSYQHRSVKYSEHIQQT